MTTLETNRETYVVKTDSVLLVLSGELDLDTAPQVRAACTDALRQDPHTLAIDLSAVSFVDISGQRSLFDTAVLAADQGTTFKL